MKYSYALPAHAAMLVRGTCIAYDVFSKAPREGIPPALLESFRKIEAAAAEILPDPKLTRVWIRCIAYSISFDKAPCELLCSVCETHFKRTKSALTRAMAQSLGVVS